MSDRVEAIIRYMVENSHEGVFRGSPRKKMEQLGGSSGPLYHALEEQGLECEHRGRSGKWKIPPHVLRRFGK